MHALLGANGAGKSTLVKILTGVIGADRGEIRLAGDKLAVSSPLDARRKRLCPVFQDPALVPDLSIHQNLKLTGVDTGSVRAALREMELDIDPDTLVADVPLATLRMIDLARALTYDPQVLLLDEITAALPSDLAERVFVVARAVRDRGGSVVFVSHRLAEITSLCDRATVLRDGHAVGTLSSTKGAEERIVELMLGESQQQLERGGPPHPRRRRPAGHRGPARAGRQAPADQPRAPRRRRLRGALRRDRRRRRAGGAGPGPALRGAVGHEPRPRRRDRAQRAARALPRPLRRDPPRRGARSRRPRHGAAARPPGAREHRRSAVLPDEALGAVQRQGREVARRRRDRAPAGRHARRARGAAAVGRQPAEADDRALGRRRLRGAAVLRPDPRHRRRHQAPDLRPAARHGRPGIGGAAVHQRAVGDPAGVRPRRRAAPGAHQRPAAGDRGDGGAPAALGPRPGRGADAAPAGQ